MIFLVLLSIFVLFKSTKEYFPLHPQAPIQRGDSCGIENCHGMDLQCGKNIVQACDEMYQIGDGCRQFASCEITANKCQVSMSDKFIQCKSCVQNCINSHKNDDILRSMCESDCIQGQPNLPD